MPETKYIIYIDGYMVSKNANQVSAEFYREMARIMPGKNIIVNEYIKELK